LANPIKIKFGKPAIFKDNSTANATVPAFLINCDSYTVVIIDYLATNDNEDDFLIADKPIDSSIATTADDFY
jgi:hypothetical protein